MENAKLISNFLKTSKKFITILNKENINELQNIDGIGETQISSIKSFFSYRINLEILKELNNILMVQDQKNPKKDGIFKDKTFMFTGKLDGISRAEAKSLIEQNSGTIISNVSKKLNYLIIGDKPTKRKILHAKELKVKILSQNELLQKLNKRS